MDPVLKDLEYHVSHCRAQYDCRVCGAMAEYVTQQALRRQSYIWATVWLVCAIGLVLGTILLVRK